MLIIAIAGLPPAPGPMWTGTEPSVLHRNQALGIALESSAESSKTQARLELGLHFL